MNIITNDFLESGVMSCINSKALQSKKERLKLFVVNPKHYVPSVALFHELAMLAVQQ